MDDLHEVLEQLKRVERTRSIYRIHVPSASWNHDRIVRLKEQVYLLYFACCMQHPKASPCTITFFNTSVNFFLFYPCLHTAQITCPSLMHD